MSPKFSKKPTFKTQDPYSVIELVSARLAVFPSPTDICVSGSCARIAKNLYLTSRHVIEDFQKKFAKGKHEIPCEFWLIHVYPGPEYSIWLADYVWTSPITDLAIIHTKPYNDTASSELKVQCVSLNLTPPALGERVVGFGHHNTEGKIKFGTDGTRHIGINTDSSVSVGEVSKIHHKKRDSVRLPFPCYQVNARFEGGMSGGPIFNDFGQVCGVVCSIFDLQPSEIEPEHISYVATLWPAMGIMMSIGINGENVSPYPLLKLAQKGIISAVDWEKVNLNESNGEITYSYN